MFFVILGQQNGAPAALVDDEGDLAIFESEVAAQSAGAENILGRAFGFEVYSWDG